jgi:glycosyltransferase involved in cell wall biosynthesis
MSVTVIIPTTGGPELRDAIESVINQTYEDTRCYIVCDGQQYAGKVKPIVDEYLGRGQVSLCFLPINVGANGFYGHRIYAAFTHLINTKYVMYLDQDCWFNPHHVEYCTKHIEENDLDWSYSLRNITNKDGEYLCKDDCESLGKWPVFSGEYKHIDTNCYCIKTEVAVKLAQVWHGGWGQDRVWLQVLSQHFPKYDCTGYYTLNYRVAGNGGSVKPEFFNHGNKIMYDIYNGVLPWRKRI